MKLQRVFNLDEGQFAFVGAGGAHLAGIHAESEDCGERGCVAHNPDDAATANVESWPYNWREDRGLMERVCSHGVGHPDPDTARFNDRIGLKSANIHGCCGCDCGPSPARRSTS